MLTASSLRNLLLVVRFRCVADGMTGAGLGVILVLVFLAFAALLGATFYVLHRFVTHSYARIMWLLKPL